MENPSSELIPPISNYRTFGPSRMMRSARNWVVPCMSFIRIVHRSHAFLSVHPQRFFKASLPTSTFLNVRTFSIPYRELHLPSRYSHSGCFKTPFSRIQIT